MYHNILQIAVFKFIIGGQRRGSHHAPLNSSIIIILIQMLIEVGEYI